MRPWMIVLSSAVGAISAAAAIAIAQGIGVGAPPGELASVPFPRWPGLVLAALAAYGLCAVLITTATLVGSILRLRQHLIRTAVGDVSTRREGSAAFVSGMRQLAPRLAAALAQSADGGAGIAFDVRLMASDIRNEIARLYYVSVARVQFLSALIVLAGIAILGLAHDRASLPLGAVVIPTASAMMIIAGLILLGLLGRIAVDVAAEPLLEVICQLPTERVEVSLLRRAVELLELTYNRQPVGGQLTAPPSQISERLVVLIEQARDALSEAINRLSENAKTLETAMRSSIQVIETTLRSVATQQGPLEDNKFAAAGGLSELQSAVEQLTAVLQRLSAVPEDAEAAPATDRSHPPQTASTPRLARELRQLLQDIEAAR